MLLLAACGDTPLPFVPTPEPTPEQPRPVAVLALSGPERMAINGAGVTHNGSTVLTDETGHVTLMALTGDEVEVSAPGHDPGTAEITADERIAVELRPNVVSGTVTDAAGDPLTGVRVFVDGGGRESLVETDEDGAYALADVPEGATIVFKVPGFRLAEAAVTDGMALNVALEPFEARALYAPSAVFEAPGRLDDMLAQIDRTEANAMVIDVKETDGRLYYATDLETAAAVGAVRENPIFELEELLPMLEERGIYTIARMVVMKDNTSAAARPELAVRNVSNGEPWRDNIGGAWLDPSAPGVAEYIASIARDLADKGFDEVQLDYIRFYSDGPYNLAETNLPNTQSFRLPAIQRVLRVVRDELMATRAFLSADVFPIPFIVGDDQGIGQRPEVFIPYVDYLSPMAYPSHYGPGMFGFEVPNNFPYEVVDQTLEIMNGQREGSRVVLRPWIQDFGYGQFPPYTASQVRDQMRAAAERDAAGWMIWNARASFTEAALRGPRDGEDAGTVVIDVEAAAETPAPTGTPVPTGSPAPSGSP